MAYEHTRERPTKARRAMRLMLVAVAAACVVSPLAADAQFQYEVSRQPCFGAAARDPEHRCSNPRLALSVVPTPSQAASTPSPACIETERTRRFLVLCHFGARVATATANVALVGDSHAWHWKAAVEVAARTRAWRGVSITRSSCQFSRATPSLPAPAGSQCRQWNAQVLGWFAKHPEVSTVLVSDHAGGQVEIRGGASQLEAQINGYIGAWKALPATVKRIVVIRDTPVSRSSTRACVQHAIATRQRAGVACAVPRSMAIGGPDPAVLAAARVGSKRVRAVDLTRFFCDARLCYPVIGGALVFRDIGHLTDAFSVSLGPFLLRAVERAR